MPLLAKRKAIQETTTLAMATTIEITDLLRDRTIPEIAEQLRLTMPAVTAQFGEIAATVSANDYNVDRSSLDLPNQYVATPVVESSDKATQSAIGFGIAQITRGAPYEIFQSTLAGSVQRLVSNGDRDTVQFNIVTDPDGSFYERVPRSGACAFCMTIAAVATTKDNLRKEYFDSYHNFCRCQIRPVFIGQEPTDLPEYKQAREAYSLANNELLKEQQEARRLFDIDRKAQGLPIGGSRATTAFQKANPELSLTTENILRNVRKITGQK